MHTLSALLPWLFHRSLKKIGQKIGKTAREETNGERRNGEVFGCKKAKITLQVCLGPLLKGKRTAFSVANIQALLLYLALRAKPLVPREEGSCRYSASVV